MKKNLLINKHILLMKRLLISISALILILSVAETGNAFTFDMNTYDVTLNSSDPGLVLWWEPVLTSFSTDLSVGQSATFDLFKIGTDEQWINNDDKIYHDIAVNFKFSYPDVSNNVNGITYGKWFVLGKVEWDGATDFYFGNNGLFTIELSDEFFLTDIFCIHSPAVVQASITYKQADNTATTPVPEPTTLLLLGTGLVGIGAFRKKFKK